MARLEQLPPCDLGAKRALLGSLLIGPEVILDIDPPLSPSDFYHERNGALYAILASLGEAACGDWVTISDEVRSAGLDWTQSEMIALAAETPTSVHAHYYAAIVREKAALRRLFNAAAEIAKLAYAPDADSRAVWEQARQAVDQAITQDGDTATLTFQESLIWYLSLLERRTDEHRTEQPTLAFPWQALKSYTPRLRPGTVAIVAAASGVGKTAFCECCAEEWARIGFKVAFFHFELAHEVMLDRRTARLAGVPIWELEQGKRPEDVDRITDQISRWPGGITYVHCPGWTMQRVALKARQLAGRGLADAVIVDYLQKARYQEQVRGLTPAQMRGQDVEGLKVLAEELGIVVLLASQLNREAQSQKRKTRFTIRDTGEADEKANIVITLDREILEIPLRDGGGKLVADEGELSPEVTVRVDKNTLGKTGEGRLVLNGERFRLADMAEE